MTDFVVKIISKRNPDVAWEWIKHTLALHGLNFTAIARLHDITTASLTQIKYRHRPKFERIIASYVGRTPQQIWPARYENKRRPGRPKKGQSSKVDSTKGSTLTK